MVTDEAHGDDEDIAGERWESFRQVFGLPPEGGVQTCYIEPS